MYALSESAVTKLAAATAALAAIGLSLQEVGDLGVAENLVNIANEDEIGLDDAHEQMLDMAYETQKDAIHAARQYCQAV